MRQVLFTIPIFGGIKIFGYGVMLVFAFFGSTGLAAWCAAARSSTRNCSTTWRSGSISEDWSAHASST